MENEWCVTVFIPGHGRFTGGTYDKCLRFRDEHKARDYYAEMLVKYPNYTVELHKIR